MSQLLLDNFHDLTHHPSAADELRRLVLDLAVRGKLVPQDPKDEPAEVLLERIRAERARRVKAGELRKSKPLPDVGEEEKPFWLPEGWVWCRLGEVFESDYGTSTKTSANSSDVPILRMGNITTDGAITYSSLKYAAPSKVDLPRLALEKGDLLFNRTNSYELVGKSGIFTGSKTEVISFASYLIRLRPILNPSTSNYTIHYLCSGICRWSQVEPGIIQQNGQANFNGTKLKNILLPLPPLTEQHRIVARVETLLGQAEKLKAQAEKTQSLTTALIPALLSGLAAAPDLGAYWREMIVPNFGLFALRPAYCDELRRLILDLAVRGRLVAQEAGDEPAEVLLERIKAERARRVQAGELRKSKPLPAIGEEEKPFGLPDGWVWCRLGEITSKMGSGSTPRGGKSAYKVEGIPFLRSQNIHNNGLVLDDVPFISQEVHQKMGGTKVISNDVLLNITGGSLGRCALVSDESFEANVSQHVSIIRFIEVLPSFGHLMMLSPYIQKEIFDSVTGAGREGLPKYNQTKFLIPLPPIPEQHRIVARVETLREQVERLKQISTAKHDARERLLKALVQS